MRWLQSMAVALSMYSKLPVPTVEWDEKNMKYAMCFFPVVGAVTGGLQFLLAYILLEYTQCGTLFFAAVMTLLPVLVTGGIHCDGFADTVDALSSYGDREKKLEILKDPHTGAFAVIGLCCYFLLSAGLWSGIPACQDRWRLLAVLSCMYMFSRALSGISVVTFPAAKKSGLLKTFQEAAQRKRVRAALIIWAVCSGAAMLFLGCKATPAGMAGLAGSAAVAAGLLVFLYYYQMSRKKFGGTTGDLAGWFLQMCELAMLFAVTVIGGCL